MEKTEKISLMNQLRAIRRNCKIAFVCSGLVAVGFAVCAVRYVKDAPGMAVLLVIFGGIMVYVAVAYWLMNKISSVISPLVEVQE